MEIAITDQTAVEDEIEIRNLIARLARLTDIGTVEEYLEAFTDDAVLEIPGLPIRSGTEGLRSGSLGSRETGAAGPGSNTMHFLGAISVNLDGDTATSDTTFFLFKDTSTSPTPATAGRYHDLFVRTPKGWRLRHRNIQFG
jgi:ketosteroid isomerase-like protein